MTAQLSVAMLSYSCKELAALLLGSMLLLRSCRSDELPWCCDLAVSMKPCGWLAAARFEKVPRLTAEHVFDMRGYLEMMLLCWVMHVGGIAWEVSCTPPVMHS